MLTPKDPTCERPAQNRLAALPIFMSLYMVSLVVDLAIGMALRFRLSPAGLEADEREYYDIARGLLSGMSEFNPRRSLGFPALEAGVQLFTSNFIVLQAVIAAIFAFSPSMLFLLVRRLTGDIRASLVSAVLLMLWPPGLYYGISLYSEAVALPLFLLSLVMLPPGSLIGVASARPGAMAFASGVCLALTTHVRPMYLLFLPVAGLIVLLEERRIAQAAGRFLLVLAGFTLLIAPWSVFMSTRYHHVIIVTSNGGETLAGGLNSKLIALTHSQPIRFADRSSWTGPGKWLPIANNGYLTDSEQKLPYDRIDAVLRTRTLQWVGDHPADAAYLELSKLRYMWGLSSFANSDLKLSLFGAVPTVLLLLISIGFWCWLPPLRKHYPRLWLLPLFVSGIALISWGSWRFRQAGDAGLIAFCAIGFFYLVDRRRPPRFATNEEDTSK